MFCGGSNAADFKDADFWARGTVVAVLAMGAPPRNPPDPLHVFWPRKMTTASHTVGKVRKSAHKSAKPTKLKLALAGMF